MAEITPISLPSLDIRRKAGFFKPIRLLVNIENGSFTPIVYSLNGRMSNECKVFYSRLAELISIKRNINKSMVVSWMRTKLNFSMLRSMLLCLRGPRSQKIVNCSKKISIQGLAPWFSCKMFLYNILFEH